MSISLALGVSIIVGLALTIILYIRASYSFAPWVPSSTRMARRALAALAPRAGQTFVDLGCGDGRIVFLAHRDFGLDATGYEISPFPFIIGKLRQWMRPNGAAHIEFKNLFDADLSRFDIIYFYGLPKNIRNKVKPWFERAVRPGTHIISYDFSIEGKNPILVVRDRWRRALVYRW